MRWVLAGLVLVALFFSSPASGTAAPRRVPVRGGAASSSSAGGVVTGEAGGVQISLQLAPGPYFLSELLPVQIELRNHTGHALLLDGDPTLDSGIPALEQGTAPRTLIARTHALATYTAVS